MSPAFYELHTQIKTQRPHTVVCKGGRGSTKSSFMSVEFILFLLQHPQCHGVVLRKIAMTLRNSVYAQIQWAIGALGLQNKFRCTVSPMEITYLPTGQKILFFGLDKPEKLKSSVDCLTLRISASPANWSASSNQSMPMYPNGSLMDLSLSLIHI